MPAIFFKQESYKIMGYAWKYTITLDPAFWKLYIKML